MPDEHKATLKVILGSRITIPKSIRDLQGIQVGDYVEITIKKVTATEEKP